MIVRKLPVCPKNGKAVFPKKTHLCDRDSNPSEKGTREAHRPIGQLCDRSASRYGKVKLNRTYWVKYGVGNLPRKESQPDTLYSFSLLNYNKRSKWPDDSPFKKSADYCLRFLNHIVSVGPPLSSSGSMSSSFMQYSLSWGTSYITVSHMRSISIVP